MYSTITDIAHRLYLYRKKLNKNQEEMCKVLDVTQSYYNKLENGQHLISFHSLQSLRKEGGDVCSCLLGKSIILEFWILIYQNVRIQKRLHNF